jgi:hypothetical protein
MILKYFSFKKTKDFFNINYLKFYFKKIFFFFLKKKGLPPSGFAPDSKRWQRSILLLNYEGIIEKYDKSLNGK